MRFIYVHDETFPIDTQEERLRAAIALQAADLGPAPIYDSASTAECALRTGEELVPDIKIRMHIPRRRKYRESLVAHRWLQRPGVTEYSTICREPFRLRQICVTAADSFLRESHASPSSVLRTDYPASPICGRLLAVVLGPLTVKVPTHLRDRLVAIQDPAEADYWSGDFNFEAGMLPLNTPTVSPGQRLALHTSDDAMFGALWLIGATCRMGELDPP